MIILIVSNSLIIIITVLGICGWFLMPICAIKILQPFKRTLLLADTTRETAKMKFLLNNSSNILRNSLNTDKNVTLFNHPLPHSFIPAAFDTTVWQLKQNLLEADEIAVNDIVPHPVFDKNVKIHNDFRYAFNKSNQENNLNNSLNQATTLLSNIKLVNSSNLSPSSSTSSPGITEAKKIKAANSTITVSSYFERVEMHESLMRSKNEKLLLHRSKRYLLFPEGSSFQLVFDLIIPIVDYTNFAIMGITCAVAWELPSKPPSEIIENFRTKLNDGTFGLSRRNDTVLQPLMYINSIRTEQQAAEDRKKWSEGITVVHNQHNLPQLSATTATTSGREHFFTNAPQPPLLQPSSNLYYNNYIQREKIQQPTSFFYGQQSQQQQEQWHNNNYKTFDINQRKTLYANNNAKKPMKQNEFYSHANKGFNHNDHRQPANKWNTENWQQKIHQQSQQRKTFYSDKSDFWKKDNWWERNKNVVEKHWQKSQPKWSKIQEIPQVTFQQFESSKRTARKRKILKEPPKHRIYPIFGKRRRRRSSGDRQIYSFDSDMTEKLQAIHTKQHLQTRQKLYRKIEKLYKTRGQNGTACVLRTLCETERMHLNSHFNDKPQSFVMELLRSIFALPKDTLTNSKESLLQIDDRYVNAVFQAHDATQGCSQQYGDCVHSITYDTHT